MCLELPFSPIFYTRQYIRHLTHAEDHKPLQVFDYQALSGDARIDPTTIGLKGSPTNIFKSFTPPQKGQGKMLEGADKATCETLAAELLKKHII